MPEPTRDQIAQDYAKALVIIDHLTTSRAELLAACRGALEEFSEWEGPEEDIPAGQYAEAARARNRSVRAYEAIRTAVANAEKPEPT